MGALRSRRRRSRCSGAAGRQRRLDRTRARRTASPCTRVHTTGSAYPEVRASGTVCATLPQLVAFVEDVAAFEQWIPDTAEARLLERPSPRSADLLHPHVDAVAGERPRHGLPVVRGRGDRRRPRRISVVIEGLPDYLPVDPHAVRMNGRIGSLDISIRPAAGPASTSTCTSNPAAACRPGSPRQRIVGTPTRMLTNLKEHFETLCPRSIRNTSRE